MTLMRLRWIIVFTAAAVLGVAVGSGGALMHPPVALASCENVHYLTDAVNDGANMSTHRGNRPYTANGGMWIESVNASCVRVSSVFIISNDQSDWNEVGWFDAEGSPSCSYTGSGPRLLWTAVDNTVYYCATQTPPALTKGQYDNFGVRDTNADGSWEYTHSGSVFKPFTNPHFTTGFPTTNGERHSTSDQAYAEFRGLQFQNSSGWHDWINPTAFSGVGGNTNNDPAWCNQFDSDTHIEVVSC